MREDQRTFTFVSYIYQGILYLKLKVKIKKIFNVLLRFHLMLTEITFLLKITIFPKIYSEERHCFIFL